SVHGEARLVGVDGMGAMRDEEIAALFHKARTPEYQAVMHGCRELLRHLDRNPANPRRSIPKLRGGLDGLKRELDRIQGIDYLKTPLGARARTLWETTTKRLRAAETRPRPPRGRHRTSFPPPATPSLTPPP